MTNPFGRPFSELPNTGYLRLRDIIRPYGPIPVGKSTWWSGVKDGRFPRPVKLGARLTVWRVDDIRRLINDGPHG
ncbi:MAG: AlpA family phage regulatory protein [Beijerinckiaceae bacterium]|nr:AlpA family phage regulatory protein [Beijerinckiaceae bacterium]